MWLYINKTIKKHLRSIWINHNIWTLFICWFKWLKMKFMIQLEIWTLTRYLRILKYLLLFLKVGWHYGYHTMGWYFWFLIGSFTFRDTYWNIFIGEIMSGISFIFIYLGGISFKMSREINKWRYKWNMTSHDIIIIEVG